MRVQQMNHVNLIGQMSSDPVFADLDSGKRVARFSLSTKESYLDENGDTKNSRNWHKVTAWGKWVPYWNNSVQKVKHWPLKDD